jgi:hypothetical protein
MKRSLAPWHTLAELAKWADAEAASSPPAIQISRDFHGPRHAAVGGCGSFAVVEWAEVGVSSGGGGAAAFGVPVDG